MNYQTRYEKLREKMKEAGLDAVYVNSPENFRYMSGYNNPDGHMLITADAAYEYSDFRYIEAARAESFPTVNVMLYPENRLIDVVKEQGIKKIGIEDTRLTVAELAGLKKSLDETGTETYELGNTFTEIRAVKDKDEIDSIVAAQRIAEGAFRHLLNVINYDMAEVEVAAELEYYMKKNGSQKPSFDTNCASGSASFRSEATFS